MIFMADVALLWYDSKHPGSSADGAVPVALGIALLAGVLYIFAKPPKCGVCGQRTGGKMGVARVNGMKMKA